LTKYVALSAIENVNVFDASVSTDNFIALSKDYIISAAKKLKKDEKETLLLSLLEDEDVSDSLIIKHLSSKSGPDKVSIIKNIDENSAALKSIVKESRIGLLVDAVDSGDKLRAFFSDHLFKFGSINWLGLRKVMSDKLIDNCEVSTQRDDIDNVDKLVEVLKTFDKYENAHNDEFLTFARNVAQRFVEVVTLVSGTNVRNLVIMMNYIQNELLLNIDE
jgi:hypothetical protein